jgi:very-short-patch-repair endonuclease
VRRVAALARAEAENPFESCLRAIASEVPGLAVEPQVLITSVQPWARPDLVDRSLGVALEADSFEWHGDRAALRRDARRYDLLVVDGWLVLRFAWEDVMFDADFVRQVLVAVVALGPAG